MGAFDHLIPKTAPPVMPQGRTLASGTLIKDGQSQPIPYNIWDELGVSDDPQADADYQKRMEEYEKQKAEYEAAAAAEAERKKNAPPAPPMEVAPQAPTPGAFDHLIPKTDQGASSPTATTPPEDAVPAPTEAASEQPNPFAHLIPKEAKKEDGGDAIPALKRSGGIVLQGLGSTGKIVGDIVGAEGLAEKSEALRKSGTEIIEANPAKIQQIEKIKGLGDAIDWAQGTIPEQAGPMAAILSARLAGAGIGAGVGAFTGPGAVVTAGIGSMIGAGGMSYTINAGDLYSTLVDEGKLDPEKAKWFAGAGAIPIAFLDAITPWTIGSKLLQNFGKQAIKELGKEAGEKAVKEATGELARRLGFAALKEAAKIGLTEGGTEFAQEGVQTLIEMGALDKTFKERGGLSRLVNAGAAGLVGGGALGYGVQAVAPGPRKEPADEDAPPGPDAAPLKESAQQAPDQAGGPSQATFRVNPDTGLFEDATPAPAAAPKGPSFDEAVAQDTKPATPPSQPLKSAPVPPNPAGFTDVRGKKAEASPPSFQQQYDAEGAPIPPGWAQQDRSRMGRAAFEGQETASPAPMAEAVKIGPEAPSSPQDAGVSKAPKVPQSTLAAPIPLQAPETAPVAEQITEAEKQFQTIQERKSTYRRWLDELAQVRKKNLETNPPAEVVAIDQQIAQAQNALKNAGARRRPFYEQQIADLKAAREDVIKQALSVDTPDMKQVRDKLMSEDFKARDLAPEVSRAKQERQAKAVPAQPATPQQSARTIPAQETKETTALREAPKAEQPVDQQQTPQATPPASQTEQKAQPAGARVITADKTVGITQDPSPEMRDVRGKNPVRDKFQKELNDELRKAGVPDDIAVKVVDSIDDPETGEKGIADGRFFGKLMEIAQDRGLDNARAATFHEIIHALRERGLIPDKHWNALAEAAKRHWIKKYNVRKGYEGKKGYNNEDAIIEEAIAHAATDYAKGKLNPPGILRQALQHIRNLIEGFGNWVKYNNFKSSDGIFKAIREGRGAAEVEAGAPSSRPETPSERFSDPSEELQIEKYSLRSDIEPLTVNEILNKDFPAEKPRSKSVSDIAKGLDARGQAALKALGFKSGKIEEPSPDGDSVISRAIASEIEAALKRNGRNALDWYTTKVKEAVAVAAIQHPEIETDKNARMAFTAALAVTSQGETVPSNVRLAEIAYGAFKSTGKFPTDIKADKQIFINGNFQKLNDLIDRIGLDGTRDFLSQSFVVKDLEEVGYKIGGENKQTKVYGSAILGSKIGQGFYQNLNGNFDPVTMDLWFMRAWGRLTGTLVGLDQKSLDNQKARLTAALVRDGRAVPKTTKALRKVAEDIVKTHEVHYKKNSADYKSKKFAKSELTLSAERYIDGTDGINESPKSGGQREWMRSVVNAARDILAKNDYNMTPADLQATWWYPEKELYHKLGGRDSEGINIDYATAFADAARARGVSDEAIQERLRSVDNGPRPADTADDGRGKQKSRSGGEGVDGKNEEKFSLRERADREVEGRTASSLRSEIVTNLSASTGSIPGLKSLTMQAASGDKSAARLLNDIAKDSLTSLFSAVKSAKVQYVDVEGLYQGDSEPALAISASFDEADRSKALAVLAQFAKNFNQQQIHVRTDAKSGTEVGYSYSDGSYNTSVVQFKLKAPLPLARVNEVLSDAGIVGANVSDEAIEIYYSGKPDDAEAIQRFSDAAERVGASLGEDAQGIRRATARLWAYGDGPGATNGYGEIQGKLYPPKGDRANASAQRIAARIAGRVIKPAAQDAITSKDQSKLQKRIAAAYDAMRVDALDDPNVRRAYKELAEELVQQYDAIPVKVEIFSGEGEPYGGQKMSETMRADVNYNNHLYIYGTDATSFGPDGRSYDNHPLLEKSEYTDINGKPLLMNDLLRAVHDYYAHTMSPVGFGPKGEEAAWRNHMLMTKSPWARWALTSETRGQNSWVNFRDSVEGKALKDRGFAEQKVDLLPVEFARTGEPDVDANLSELPKSTARYSLRQTDYPELQDGARRLADGDITADDYQKLVNKYKPVRKYTEVPKPATRDEMFGALHENKRDTAAFKYSLRNKDVDPSIDTPAFKKWFGNSKVVDENGEPLVVYHGTNRRFDAFSKNKIGIGVNAGREGFYFSDNKYTADGYSKDRDGILSRVIGRKPRVVEGYLSMQNPLMTSRMFGASEIEGLKSQGYDGIIWSPEGYPDVKQYIIFEPTQIKSKDNRGTYDGTDPRMKYSLREKPQSGFYSALTRAVEDQQQKQALPGIWSSMIDNMVAKGTFKKAEVEWSGVKDWLKEQRGPVTREALADYLRSNEVDVKEVMRGAPDKPSKDVQDAIDEFKELSAKRLHDRDDFTNADYDNLLSVEKYLKKQGYINEDGDLEPPKATKFGEYVLPGGDKNYRELLLTVNRPTEATGDLMEQLDAAKKKFREAKAAYDKHVAANGGGNADAVILDEDVDAAIDARTEAQKRVDAANKKARDETFNDGHYPEPNVLAHIRFNDRTGPNGENILHVEEIQSDWHQKGRDRGYRKTQTIYQPVNRISGNPGPEFKSKEEATAYVEKMPTSVRPSLEIIEIEETKGDVPDAPYKDTKEWTALAAKHVLKYATENGYDGVSWTTGKQQADRYKLSKVIKKITLEPTDPMAGTFELVAIGKNGETVLRETDIEEKDIPNYIGKEAADRLLHSEENEQRLEAGISAKLEGLDLDIGGKGMLTSYDQIIPSVFNKLARAFGPAKAGSNEPPAVVGKVKLDLTPTKVRVGDLEQEDIEAIKDLNGLTDREWIRASDDQQKKWATDYLARNNRGTDVHYLPITQPMRDTIEKVGQTKWSLRDKPAKAPEDVRKEISLATGQKGIQVVRGGKGASYDPLLRTITVSDDWDDVQAAADLAKAPAPTGWQSVTVKGTDENGKPVYIQAGDIAKPMRERINKAMSLLECLK